MFDRNKDGYIDLNELKKVIGSVLLESLDRLVIRLICLMCPQVTSLIGTSLSAADLYKFMAEADKVRTAPHSPHSPLTFLFQDGNGKIDYNEFVAMMKQY